MFIKSLNNLRGSVWPIFFVLVPLLLIGAGKTSGDTSSPDNSTSSMFSPVFTIPSADDLPSQINNLLKKELEKEFGPLNDKIVGDETEMWGRVVGIDYELPEGKRLDDTWGEKVAKALGRLGITATYDGNEVTADGQEIAGKVASNIQFTTQRTLEDPDVIGFVAMFSRNN